MTWSVVEIVGNASMDGSTLTVNGQSFVNLSVTADGVTRTYPFRFEKEPLIGTANNPFPINNYNDLTAFRNGINTGAPFSYKHFSVPAFGENTCFIQFCFDIAIRTVKLGFLQLIAPIPIISSVTLAIPQVCSMTVIPPH